MKLGVNLGYVVGADVHEHVALAQEADRLGYAVAWVAEAYGSDSPTVASWVASKTSTIDIGTAVMQIPARSPAMTAMTAATLDLLSGGRFRLGIGVSGPQVSEGWHGVRFDRPLARTREYVAIVKQALARERVTYRGEFFSLPLPDGPGKSLRLTVHPQRKDLPVYLAAVGPQNLELCGEIADGWLAIFFSPRYADELLSHIDTGLATAKRDRADFDVAATVPVVFDDDLEAAATPLREYVALYLGGMGSRQQNFYNQLACRMGFEAAARRVQALFLDRQQREAKAAVPLEFIDETSLIGSKQRVSERLQEFAKAGVTTLSVSTFEPDLDSRCQVLRTLAEAFDHAGVGD